MSDLTSFENPEFKERKGFFSRPEGVTGAIFLAALVGGLGYLAYAFGAQIISALGAVLAGTLGIILVGLVLYMAFDPKVRNLIWYGYKSVMRSITGMFVNLDPIGILKSYVEDMADNLQKLRKQIGALKGQMRSLSNLMEKNNQEIQQNMKIAQAARDKGKEQQMLLSSRKAARLKDSNEKYQKLHQKMQIMYRILNKMHQNSEILLEDTKDQVKLKEQERKAIRASHGAMKSAMSVISGDPDKRAMFDMAMEAVADDVANKVGEMERFMEMSANVMDRIDIQNGMFEEEGMAMLEKWEKESTLMLLNDGNTSMDTFDLDSLPQAEPEKRSSGSSSYDNMFE